jgi:hypothetical protein
MSISFSPRSVQHPGRCVVANILDSSSAVLAVRRDATWSTPTSSIKLLSLINRTVTSALCNLVYTHYQDVLYLQTVKRCHGTATNVMSFTPTTTAWPCLDRFLLISQMATNTAWRCLTQNWTEIG